MHTVMGIFSSWAEAERAARSLTLPEDRFSVISSGRQEPERTGIGAPLGGAVGGALGAAAGSSIGTAIASMMLPGVGPVLATGMVAGLVMGVTGAAIGAAEGEKVEQATEINPPVRKVFEEALRRGRAVVLVSAETEEQAESIGAELAAKGAQSLDKTRGAWWREVR